MDRTLEQTKIIVRRLEPGDLAAVIALDARNTGRRREEYFRFKLKHALEGTGVEVSLAAEHGGAFAGFLLAFTFSFDDYVITTFTSGPAAMLQSVAPGRCGGST